MSLFDKFKRKDDDLLLDDSQLNEEDNLYLKSVHKWGEGAKKPSHALTADELSGKEVTETEQENGISPAAKSLYHKVSAVPVKKNVIEDIEMKPAEAEVKAEGNDSSAFADDFLKRCKEKVETEEAERTTDVDKIIERLKSEATNRPASSLTTPEEFAKQALLRATASTGEATKIDAEPEEAPQEMVDFITEEKVLQADVEEIVMEKEDDTAYLKPSGDTEELADVIAKAISLAEEPNTEDLGETRALDTEEIKSGVATENNGATVTFDAIKETAFTQDETEVEEEFYDEEDIFFEDYKNLDDAPNLKIKSLSVIRKRTVQTIFSFIISAILVAFTFPAVKELGFGCYVNLAAVLLCLCINPYIFTSLADLFSGKITHNFAVLTAAVLNVIQLCVDIFAGKGDFAVTGVASTLLLGFCAFSAVVKERRIYKGLCVIATSERKKATIVLDKQRDTAALAQGTVEGDAVAVVSKETVNLQNFLRRSAKESVMENCTAPFYLSLLGLSVIAAIVIGVMKDLHTGFAALSLIFSLGYPTSAILISELPLKFIADRLSVYKSAIAGFAGAEELDASNIVTADVCDIFPDGTVTLVNMKAFQNNDLAKSITYAAAVAKEAKSPLYDIFAKIIGDADLANLPVAEEVTYEDKMGVSGWIGEERIFIGNRNLLQGHNIKVAAMSVDKEILRNGYFPVYVACGNTTCMLLSVKYNIDPNVAYELQTLANTGMTVLLSNRDPNVTEETVCDYFNLPEDSVKIMSSRTVNNLDKFTAFEENVDAPAVYSGDVCGLFAAISSSIKLMPTIKALAIISLILAVATVAAIIYVTFIGLLPTVLTPLNIATLQIACSLVISIIAELRK